MAQQYINIGATSNDGNGDPLRLAFEKINENFTQLYSLGSGGTAAPPPGAVQFASTNNLDTIAYNSGTWVIFGSPLRYFYSTDGINYSNQNSPADQQLNSVTPTPLGFIAVGNTGTIIDSRDIALTWTVQTSGTTENLLRVYYTDITGLYVAVGENGTILTSLDAITWTSQATGVLENLRGIAYDVDNGIYVVVGNAGTILLSEDAIDWIIQDGGVVDNLNSVVFDGNNYIATGNNGTVIVSYDGITWTS